MLGGYRADSDRVDGNGKTCGNDGKLPVDKKIIAKNSKTVMGNTRKKFSGGFFVKKYFSITVFSVLFACSIAFFLEPNDLAPGGITGISILLNALTGIKTGTWVFALNIPILIVGWWKFGGKFMISTVYSIGVVSTATNLLEGMPALTRRSEERRVG